jgi:3-oxoacyl-[acyl-carrier-protein] synthase-1
MMMPEKPGAIYLYAAGVVCNVGLSAPEAVASIRAGITLCEEADWLASDGQPAVFGHVMQEGLFPLVDELARRADFTRRIRQLLRMAGTAIIECLPSPIQAGKGTPLLLALPEHHGAISVAPQPFMTALVTQTEGRCDLPPNHATFEGRAGGMAALAAAADIIGQSPDALVLVGGVDSYRDAMLLHQLDRQGRIHTSKNADGFIPGEASAMLLVGGPSAGKRIAREPLALLSVPALGVETGHLYSQEPCLGEGLAATVRQLLQEHPDTAPICDVYTTMNGEHHWTREWGVVLTRNHAAFHPSHRLHHPAQNHGDVGAAAAPLLIALAASNARKAPDGSSPALVCASSDYGSRAATLVTTPA